jgi:hypothetical protein
MLGWRAPELGLGPRPLEKQARKLHVFRPVRAAAKRPAADGILKVEKLRRFHQYG